MRQTLTLVAVWMRPETCLLVTRAWWLTVALSRASPSSGRGAIECSLVSTLCRRRGRGGQREELAVLRA